MSGGNSYVFEISGGNSHTIQQVPSRKRTRIRHSFSDEKNRQSSRNTQAPGRQLTAAPEKTHGAALAIAKRTNTCQPLAIGQSAGCIAAARHRSKWRAAA